jgi:hypothetical protein
VTTRRRRRHCRHQWRPARRGAGESCGLCGDRFPCRHLCHHLDCADVRRRIPGRLPFTVRVVATDGTIIFDNSTNDAG